MAMGGLRLDHDRLPERVASMAAYNFSARARRSLCLLVIALAASVGAGCQRQSDTGPPAIAWQPCKGEFAAWFVDGPPDPALQCGWLSVPLDHAQPLAHSRHPVRLALTRLPARGPRQGTLLAVSGGPGIPGIQQVAGFPDAVLEQLRERFDIVAHDPRGVGHSRPAVRCDVPEDSLGAGPASSTGSLEAIRREAQRYAAACVAQTGLTVLRHIGTHQAVEDVEAIRRSLGEARLHLVAYSYGTKVAALYAERHPTGVAAMILDGVVDLSEDDTTTRIGQARGYEATFQRFADYCSSLAGCPLQAGARAQASYAALMQRLPDVEAAGTLPDRRALGEVMVGALLWSEQWRELASALIALNRGDGTALKAMAAAVPFAEHEAPLIAITCADSAPVAVPRRVRQAQLRRMQGGFQLQPIPRGAPDTCDEWPFAGNERAHIPHRDPRLPPLLFVSQRHDATTPHANGRRMASFFLSPQLTREGDGHTLVFSGADACIDHEAIDYLKNPGKPRDDRSCWPTPEVD